ncbi:golgin IMH1-like [Argentina anserina]|uniref:golgin IMH1-like n=1 Tax=Argentina anserina TaxID=57926 RepID=UPI00217684B2|nr:golgin IMH1-like [Potentilla anserina]XP_050363460.1 golgin IMH1-like [Potentilla anserina]
MASSKLLILSVFLALIFSQIRADASVGEREPLEVVRSDGADSSALKIELDQLKSKIHSLEFEVDEKVKQLQSKDEIVEQKNKIIKVNSDVITALQKEVDSLQKKGSQDAEKQVDKAHARAGELEKQVEKLKKELEAQHKEKEALEARANQAEKKVDVLILKIDKIEKTNDQQKTKIRNTERALKVAEEEMLKAKFEATLKAKALTEVHGAWLPHWLAVHFGYCKSYVEKHWNEHGKPAAELVIQKALEKKAQAGKWAEPHVEAVKTKWVPAVKEQWSVVKESVEPHVQSLKTKSIEAYETSKSTLAPHVIKAQEFVDPYFQEAKKISKPYVDQVATVAKPHVEKVRVVLKPYTKQAVQAYEKFLKSASTYHHQVQTSVRDTLKNHELTRPLATKELEWFAASALLALPVLILFRVLSSLFCTKSKKPVRSSHHSRRKAKRGHPDK